MPPATRAVAVDCSLGLAAVVIGALGLPELTLPALVLTGIGCGGQILAVYVVEQVPAWDLVVEHHPESLVLAFVVTLGVALALIVGGTVASAPVAALLIGLGAGLLAYRLVYGVARPLPARRLEQVERLGW